MTQRGAMGGPPVQPDGMSPSGARSPSSRPADSEGVRLLVCGSRDWVDRATLEEWLDEIAGVLRIAVVIDGGQRGADTMGHEWARARDYDWERYFARWNEGDNPGATRNRRMLREGKPTLVVAFPLPQSRGTWHMVRIAKEAGVTVWVYPKDRRRITAMAAWEFAM